jgi:hypothetical protein
MCGHHNINNVSTTSSMLLPQYQSSITLPGFSKPFTVEIDASATGIGVVLMQEGHPIAYLSKSQGKKAQALSSYEKECLALIYGSYQMETISPTYGIQNLH